MSLGEVLLSASLRVGVLVRCLFLLFLNIVYSYLKGRSTERRDRGHFLWFSSPAGPACDASLLVIFAVSATPGLSCGGRLFPPCCSDASTCGSSGQWLLLCLGVLLAPCPAPEPPVPEVPTAGWVEGSHGP